MKCNQTLPYLLIRVLAAADTDRLSNGLGGSVGVVLKLLFHTGVELDMIWNVNASWEGLSR